MNQQLRLSRTGKPSRLQSELSNLVLPSPKRGNIGDPSLIPDLAQTMEDSEGMVCGYAAWPLGRIGGSQTRQVLETSLARETDELAKKKIQAALVVV